jgi:phage tail-like protein
VLNAVHKLPGMARYGRLILRRGLTTTNTEFWRWFSSFAQGTGVPQSLSVVLLDSAKNQVMQWNFTNAWPVKYEPPLLRGEKSVLAIETLEIVFDTMTLAASPPPPRLRRVRGIRRQPQPREGPMSSSTWNWSAASSSSY